MRIFITGGTGFIGKPLLRALEGHDLLVLSRQAAESASSSLLTLVGDLFDPSTYEQPVRDFLPQACIHLAWSGLPDYSLPVCRRNFNAGLDLLRVLSEIRCPRIVVTGSCWEYGDLTGGVREDMPPGKSGIFASFKYSQQLLARAMLADAGSRLVWARPFFVYGPGQRSTSLIPSCIGSLASGRKPDIRSPDSVNDFIHVDDVATGLVSLVTSPAAEGIYNLGTGQPTQVRDAVNLVASLMGQSPVFPSAPAGNGMWADLNRIERDTAWKPLISIEAGIRQTLNQWRPA